MMLRIKKLNIFMLKTFLPQFLMTFFICLFIVMMQFMWSHLSDLVGKGLGVWLLAELFFYAALSLLPIALPLAILLASIMHFGNLGEHVELTALKSSGVSLVRVMSPLIVLVSFIAVGAFFFQNNVIPQAQVKMWTLLFSMRQKSPTLNIPEGTVYTQIPGYNLFVKHKQQDGDMLYNMLIYDVQNGVGYPRIVVADSGRLAMTPDKRNLVLTLYHGSWYEDMRSSGGTAGLSGDLYRRETFRDKQIIIPYDANFTRMDDETMRSQYVGKNISELLHTIDSVQGRIDSVGNQLNRDLHMARMVGVPQWRVVRQDSVVRYEPVKQVNIARPINFDSIVSALSPSAQVMLIDRAVGATISAKHDYEFMGYTLNDDNFVMRRHEIELEKKFTLSLACLIFFFIGAPLGAIIRKGGLGTPIVVSVLLFIAYYIIDNAGYKMARDGRWPVWQGIWLSSAVLLPLGIFLTKKAVDDSAVFNPDAYANFFRRLMGVHEVRKLALKEVIIDEVETDEALNRVTALRDSARQWLDSHHKQGYVEYLTAGYDPAPLAALSQQLDDTVAYLANSREQMVLNKAMDYPVLGEPSRLCRLTTRPWLARTLVAVVPVGLVLNLMAMRRQRSLLHDVASIVTVSDQLLAIVRGEYTRELEYDV